ncbi:hypothetical protein LT493_32535 [Streptomyces tricolor]|nr:hypothetical protein [Streptomyces tricolor]
MLGRKRDLPLRRDPVTLASVACAMSPNAGSLIASRVVQGLGAALMVPQVFAFVTVLVPAARRHIACTARSASSWVWPPSADRSSAVS